MLRIKRINQTMNQALSLLFPVVVFQVSIDPDKLASDPKEKEPFVIGSFPVAILFCIYSKYF